MMSKIRIFLVDTQPVWLRSMALLIEQEPDMEVVGEACDGLKAINRIQSLKPGLVMMDVTWPNLNATRRISGSNAEISVLALAAQDSEDLCIGAFQAGARGYLPKSASVEDLLKVIRKLNSGEAFTYYATAEITVSEYLERMDPYQALSLQEREMLPLLAEYRTYQEIAELLHVSHHTVQTYRQRIMKKLKFRTKAELLRYALCRGLIDIDQ